MGCDMLTFINVFAALYVNTLKLPSNTEIDISKVVRLSYNFTLKIISIEPLLFHLIIDQYPLLFLKIKKSQVTVSFQY